MIGTMFKTGIGMLADYARRTWAMMTKQHAIHCEALWNEKVWNAVKREIRKKKFVFFCLTPANYDYMKHYLGCRLSKKQVSDVLKKRYKFLGQNGQRVELHVHLWWLLYDKPGKEQKKLIVEAKKWMNTSGFDVKECILGWYTSNSETSKILGDLGLRVPGKYEYSELHDFTFLSEKERRG